jgi:hypothetical protein
MFFLEKSIFFLLMGIDRITFWARKSLIEIIMSTVSTFLEFIR